MYIEEDTLFACSVMFRFLLSADFPQKINFLKEFSNKYHIRVSNNFAPDQVKHFFSPDLGPNSLQRLSADDTSRQRVTNTHHEWYGTHFLL